MTVRWVTRLVVLAVLLCASGPARAQLLSPGPLAAAHASLEGDDNCNRCHGSKRGVSDGLCIGCHGNIGAAIAAGRGLHGGPFRGQGCAKCHSDHRGRGFALIRFNPASFDHGQTGWPLGGAHASAKCNGCHKGRGFMGLGRACSGCHSDPHSNRFGNACTNCHNETAWKQVSLSQFSHDQSAFPLRGLHAKASCDSCHGSPAKYRGLDFGSCLSCHHDPHKGRFSKTCTSCHNETGWRNVVMNPSAHPGLSLANGHLRVKCGACHDKGNYVRPTRGSRCSGCHKPVHEANFGDRCETCHAKIQWLGMPPKIGLDAHGKTSFPLRGRHQEVSCDACHKADLPPQKRFRELSFGLCRDCHSDAHDREFAARNQGECGPCHTERGFKPTTFGAAAHATTAFAVEGKHTAVPCGKCHSPSSKTAPPPQAAPTKKKSWPPRAGPTALASAPIPRRLDWKLAQAACASCHDNPHGEQFAGVMRQKGCAGCHVASGWKTTRIDHAVWPLTGGHAQAPCDRCHSPTPEDRKAGRGSSYKNTPRACDGCHADVHAGQFSTTKPVRACNACHGTASFALPSFDHKRLAGYALEGKHSAVECAKCHRPEKLKNATVVRRYRLGYRRCRECHADPHAGDER